MRFLFSTLILKYPNDVHHARDPKNYKPGAQFTLVRHHLLAPTEVLQKKTFKHGDNVKNFCQSAGLMNTVHCILNLPSIYLSEYLMN